MVFWIVAGGLGLSVAVLMLLALWRRQDGAVPEEASDVRVYRDQLAEVDRDLARGVLGEAEAQRVRVEVSRRLLEADRAARAEGVAEAPRALGWVGGAAVVAALAAAAAMYVSLGAPGYPDLPLAARVAEADAARAARPDQAEAEALTAERRPPAPEPEPRYAELMKMLRAAVEENPEDLRGLQLLAVNEARLGNFAAAYGAQEQLIAVKGAEATAADHADLADLMILAAGGYVSPAAEAVLTRALEMDPENGAAQYYMGLSYAQTGRPDLAFGIWDRLWRASDPGAPWLPPLREQMPEVAQLAGVRWSPPEPRRGPTAGDVASAGEMSRQERLEMVRGMVDGLAARLAAEGGPPEDWARLIQSLGVLGDRTRAGAIWVEAQTVFADAPDGLATIRAAAERAGVAE